MPTVDPFRLGQTLIIAPHARPSDIAAAVESTGLTREPDTTTVAPLIAGEPERGVWTRDGHKPVVVYTFNPVARLRVLDVATLPPALRGKIAEALPLLDDAEVAPLLDGPTPRDVLRGLWAARETMRIDLIAAVARVAAHADPPVAEEAALVQADLQRLAEARLQALAALRVVEMQADPVLKRLHEPDFARTLCPDEADCARLFDADIAADVTAGARRFYESGAAMSRAPPGSRVDACAATAGLLRWPNERSEQFPRGYRRIAGWMTPERIWLTWAVRTSSGGSVRYDGLAWIDDHWVWLPKPYRLVADLPTGARDETLH